MLLCFCSQNEIKTLISMILVLHFYSAFPVYWQLKALYNTCHIHPFTHTFIHWWRRLPCKVPTAHQEQFGVQYLAQGHFDMQLGGAGILTSDLLITITTRHNRTQSHVWGLRREHALPMVKIGYISLALSKIQTQCTNMRISLILSYIFA